MRQLEELQAALRSAIESHFNALKVKHGASDLYGYALYSDDGLSSLGPVANTADAIAVAASDPTYAYYRYGPHEWALFDDYGMFESVNGIVKEIHADSETSFESKRDGILQAALDALTELEARGCFGARTASRFLVLWLSDSSDPIMSASARALNSSAVFSEYAAEYQDED